jgi:two-component system osmolarity sensor histidine kinase EnvZ
LTQPFFRGDSARTAATGSGLGLTIVARSVKRMGGTLSMDTPASGGLRVALKFRAA